MLGRIHSCGTGRLAACTALCVFSFISFISSPVEAQESRPRIGLVLEGGGALGIAHVGVLKVLEEERVPVDIITGTSMGSIVGAAYASGQTIEEMEEVLSTTDWEALFLEEPERQSLPFRLKPGRNREIYGAAKVGLKDGNLVFPMALIEGQRVLPLFQRLFDNAPYPKSFDDLPVRYRAVAADIETGEAVVLASGDLARSARASMAVPGVFAPMELDGRLLVDGAIRNNFPADIAKEMGADILIGSYFEYEFRKRDELKNPISILGQMLDFLLAETSERNLKILGPKDVRITPDVSEFTTSSFDQAKAIMAAGEAAARKAVPSLRRFSVSESEFRRFRERRTRRGLDPEIEFVRIANHSSLPDSLIARQVRTVPGKSFDRKTLEEDVERIHNVGNLREVRYELVEDGNERGVVLHVHEKEWVEQYFRFGFAVEDNFEGDSNYSLGLSLRTNNVTPMGGYTELDAEIGKTPGISAELYQPITENRRFFVAPFLAYGERPVFVRQGGETLAEYRRTLGFADLDLGMSLGSYGEATIGLRRGFGELEREVGDEALPEFSFDVGEARAEIVLDKLDQPDFPRSGFLARLSERSALEELGASDSFDQLAGNASLPLTWGRNTLLLRTDFGVTFDRLPVEQSFALGGFLDISGFLQGELTASDYVVGTAAYYHRLTRAGGALFGADILAGASVEMASLRSDIPAIPDNSSILAGSVFLGSDTTLIPVYLAFGLNDENEESFYLVFGRLRPARR